MGKEKADVRRELRRIREKEPTKKRIYTRTRAVVHHKSAQSHDGDRQTPGFSLSLVGKSLACVNAAASASVMATKATAFAGLVASQWVWSTVTGGWQRQASALAREEKDKEVDSRLDRAENRINFLRKALEKQHYKLKNVQKQIDNIGLAMKVQDCLHADAHERPAVVIEREIDVHGPEKHHKLPLPVPKPILGHAAAKEPSTSSVKSVQPTNRRSLAPHRIQPYEDQTAKTSNKPGGQFPFTASTLKTQGAKLAKITKAVDENPPSGKPTLRSIDENRHAGSKSKPGIDRKLRTAMASRREKGHPLSPNDTIASIHNTQLCRL